MKTFVCGLVLCSGFSWGQTGKFDVPYWTALGVVAAGTVLDGYSTVSTIGTRNCEVEVGNPGLYGRVPTAWTVTRFYVPELIGTAVVSHELRTRLRGKGRGFKGLILQNLWLAPLIQTGRGHWYGGIHNLEHCR